MSAASPRQPTPTQDPTLERLYRDEAAWLQRQLRRRFGRSLHHLVEDLVQDAFLRLAVSPPAPLRAPRALLLTVASRLALDAERKRSRAQRFAESLGLIPIPLGDGADEAILLKQVILSMPPLYRDVFVLARFRGLTYPQIADTLGLSVKAVEWRMAKALSHAAQALKP